MATSSVKKSTKKPVSRVGSVRMSKKKGFSFKPWQALVAVLFVAVAGYAVVRFSQAGVNRSFEYNATQLTGDGTNTTKADGTSSRVLVFDTVATNTILDVYTANNFVSSATLQKTEKVCAQVKFLKQTNAYFFLWYKTGQQGGERDFSTKPHTVYSANSTTEICTMPINPSLVYPGSYEFGLAMHGTGTVAVNKIYGVAPTRAFTHGIGEIKVFKTNADGTKSYWDRLVAPSQKTNGETYREVPAGYSAYTAVTAQELTGGNRACARFKVITPVTNLTISAGVVDVNGQGMSGGTDLGSFQPGIYDLCGNGIVSAEAVKPGLEARISVRAQGGVIAVDTLYGVYTNN